ncbi:hypothetical protein HMPREF9120_00603 [Neisseria sp. oral taxon 020 str. F0370]|nr:hypothetical protein HMPREF9120_00603 [Neisseria sp. oral taxon 020 str. F0370]
MRENVFFKIGQQAGGVVWLPAVQIVGMPAAGKGFKRVLQRRPPLCFVLLFGGGGVNALSQVRPRLFGGLAGFQQGNSGIFADGESSLSRRYGTSAAIACRPQG